MDHQGFPPECLEEITLATVAQSHLDSFRRWEHAPTSDGTLATAGRECMQHAGLLSVDVELLLKERALLLEAVREAARVMEERNPQEDVRDRMEPAWRFWALFSALGGNPERLPPRSPRPELEENA